MLAKVKKILTEYFLSISHSALVRFPVALSSERTQKKRFLGPAMDATNADTNVQVVCDEVATDGGSTYEELQNASRTSDDKTQYSRLELANRGRHASAVYANADRVRN